MALRVAVCKGFKKDRLVTLDAGQNKEVDYMTPTYARRLAERLVKAADKAEALTSAER